MKDFYTTSWNYQLVEQKLDREKMVEMALKQPDYKDRIVIPTLWLKDFEDERLIMYSEENKKEIIILSEKQYKKLGIMPKVMDVLTPGKKGLITIKKRFMEVLEVNKSDALHLVYNKKIKVIVIIKAKVKQFEDKFAKDFASFFADPIVQSNIKIINKMEEQKKKREEKNE